MSTGEDEMDVPRISQDLAEIARRAPERGALAALTLKVSVRRLADGHLLGDADLQLDAKGFEVEVRRLTARRALNLLTQTAYVPGQAAEQGGSDSLAEAFETLVAAPGEDLSSRADLLLLDGVPLHLRARLSRDAAIVSLDGEGETLALYSHGRVRRTLHHRPDEGWRENGATQPLRSCRSAEDAARLLARGWFNRAQSTLSGHETAAFHVVLRRIRTEGLAPLLAIPETRRGVVAPTRPEPLQPAPNVAERLLEISSDLARIDGRAETAGLQLSVMLSLTVQRISDGHLFGHVHLVLRPGAARREGVSSTCEVGRRGWDFSRNRADSTDTTVEPADSLLEAFEALFPGAPPDLSATRPDLLFVDGVPFHLRARLPDGAAIVSRTDGFGAEVVSLHHDGGIGSSMFQRQSGGDWYSGPHGRVPLRGCARALDVAALLARKWLRRGGRPNAAQRAKEALFEQDLRSSGLAPIRPVDAAPARRGR